MFEIHGAYSMAKVYTDLIDQTAVAQITALCSQPFAEGASIRIMPIVATLGHAAGVAAGLACKAGIGYLLIYGGQVFNLDLVMTSVIVLCVMAALMYFAVALLEKFIRKSRG